MKANSLTTFSILSICACLISCEKPTTSTTYITNNEIPVADQPQINTLEIDTETHSEIESIAGKHSTGKLYLRYDNNTQEMKKWTILAPYEVTIHTNYIEVKFSGNYYMDGEPTGDGQKKLFIKKKDLKTILVSE